MTPIYQSTATVLPSKGSGGAAGGAMQALSSLAGGGQLAALAGAAGLGGGDDLYVALLRSQSVQDRLIERFNLGQRYGADKPEWARERLTAAAAVGLDRKSGLLRISVMDTDPALAAELANAHVQELNAMLGRLATTEAQQRRLFFEQQIERGQKKLAELDERFRQALERSGLQLTSLLAEGQIRALADLRAQIASREIQLQAMSRFATSQNSDVQRLSSEVAALQAQLHKMEQGTGPGAREGKPLQQEAMMAYRELKVQEGMLEGYVRQLAAARFDEAREGPPVQLVDEAQPAQVRSKPERTKIVLGLTGAGLFLGLFLGGLCALLQWSRRDPNNANRWQELRKAWR
jgi:uncharacterized protein involved in exopolysaccharide biosynthesis